MPSRTSAARSSPRSTGITTMSSAFPSAASARCSPKCSPSFPTRPNSPNGAPGDSHGSRRMFALGSPLAPRNIRRTSAEFLATRSRILPRADSTDPPHPSPDPGDPIRRIGRIARAASPLKMRNAGRSRSTRRDSLTVPDRLGERGRDSKKPGRVEGHATLGRGFGEGGSSDIGKSQLCVPSSDG